MIQKLKLKLLALSFVLITPVVAAVPVLAQADIQDSLCTGANELTVPAGGGSGSGCSAIEVDENSFNELLTKIINIMSVIVGVVAVIMIIIGGFRYITSGGQPDKVTGAKNTILYGLIGLIIVALSQVIVRFVLTQFTGD